MEELNATINEMLDKLYREPLFKAFTGDRRDLFSNALPLEEGNNKCLHVDYTQHGWKLSIILKDDAVMLRVATKILHVGDIQYDLVKFFCGEIKTSVLTFGTAWERSFNLGDPDCLDEVCSMVDEILRFLLNEPIKVAAWARGRNLTRWDRVKLFFCQHDLVADAGVILCKRCGKKIPYDVDLYDSAKRNK